MKTRKKLLALILAAAMVMPTASYMALQAEESAAEAVSEGYQEDVTEVPVQGSELTESASAEGMTEAESALAGETAEAGTAPEEKGAETVSSGGDAETETASSEGNAETEAASELNTEPVTEAASEETTEMASETVPEESGQETFSESETEEAEDSITAYADSDYGINFLAGNLGHLIKGQYFESDLRDDKETNTVFFEVVDGSLPAGITLSRDGVLSGIPNIVGRYEFVIRGNYTDGTYEQMTCSIIVIDEVSSTISLKEGKRYLPYSTGIVKYEPGWYSVTKSNWLQFVEYTDGTFSLSGTPDEAGTHEVIFTYFAEDNGVVYEAKDIVYTINISELSEEDIINNNGGNSGNYAGEDDGNYYILFQLGGNLGSVVQKPETELKLTINGTLARNVKYNIQQRQGSVLVAIPKETNKLEDGDTIVLNIKNDEEKVNESIVYRFKIDIKETETEKQTESEKPTETEKQPESGKPTETEKQPESGKPTETEKQTENEGQTEQETKKSASETKQSEETETASESQTDAAKTEAAKTGDTTNIVLWLILMCTAAAVGIFGAVLRRKASK